MYRLGHLLGIISVFSVEPINVDATYAFVLNGSYIVGAASACSISSERTNTALQKAETVFLEHLKSAAANSVTKEAFDEAVEKGKTDISSGKMDCREAESLFHSFEQTLNND